jgi:hypothetical protein
VTLLILTGAVCWSAATAFTHGKDISSILHFSNGSLAGVEEIPTWKKKVKSALKGCKPQRGGGEGGALSAWLGLFWGLEEREVNYETCLLKRRYRLVEIDGSKELCLRGWL